MEAINRSPILGVSEMGRRVAQKPPFFMGNVRIIHCLRVTHFRTQIADA